MTYEEYELYAEGATRTGSWATAWSVEERDWVYLPNNSRDLDEWGLPVG